MADTKTTERPCTALCSECDPSLPHHWMDDGSTLGGYGCKHCPAVAVECVACDNGETESEDEEGRTIVVPCDQCGGEVITEVVRITQAEVDRLRRADAAATAMAEAIQLTLANLDRLVEVWGAEGVTRTVQDALRAALALADKGGD